MSQSEYFSYIPNLTTSEEKAELLAIAERFKDEGRYIDLYNHAKQAHVKIDMTGRENSIFIYPLYDIMFEEQYKVIKNFAYKYNIPNCSRIQNISFMWIPANSVVGKHIDVEQYRPVVLSLPLNENPAGTYFFETMESKEPLYYLEYTEPVLLNVQKPHSVHNNNEERFTIQIGYNGTYNEVKDAFLG